MNIINALEDHCTNRSNTFESLPKAKSRTTEHPDKDGPEYRQNKWKQTGEYEPGRGLLLDGMGKFKTFRTSPLSPLPRDVENSVALPTHVSYSPSPKWGTASDLLAQHFAFSDWFPLWVGSLLWRTTCWFLRDHSVPWSRPFFLGGWRVHSFPGPFSSWALILKHSLPTATKCLQSQCQFPRMHLSGAPAIRWARLAVMERQLALIVDFAGPKARLPGCKFHKCPFWTYISSSLSKLLNFSVLQFSHLKMWVIVLPTS